MGEDCCGEKTLESKEKLMGNITCPKCGNVQPMEVPTTSCQAFYKCEGCKEIISAQKSCCVFCDFGDRMCPVAAEHKK